MADPTLTSAERLYDDLAPRYDVEVGGTSGAAFAKARSTRELRRLFGAGDRVLDVGCGTGADACLLASLGAEVYALDLSSAMLGQAEARAKASDVADRVHPVHLPASRVGELEGVVGTGGLTGAYSLFGSLNLEPSLAPFREGLARLLQPGAPLLVGLVNPHVLWELTLYPLILRFDKPAKKSGRTVEMRVSNVGTGRVGVRMMTPKEFAQAMEPQFVLQWVEATNVIVPPPHLDKFARPLPGLLRVLGQIERRVAARPPWNRLGYFSLILLRRAPD